MRHPTLVTTAVLLCIVLGLSTQASAFVRTMTCTSSGAFACEAGEAPIPIFWPGSCVRWHLNEEGYSRIDFAALESAVLDGFDVWNEPECSQFQFVYGGQTSDAEQGHRSGGSNANIVVFRETSWSHQPSALALTSVTYAPSNGNVVDADLEINAVNYTFTVGDSGVQIDLVNTIAHEAGHVLGLDHSAVSSATMFATAPEGEVSKRDLDDDDIAGLCDAYPPGGDEVACAGGPSGFFEGGGESSRPTGDGPSCGMVGVQRHGGAGFWLLFLGIVLIGIRRRRDHRSTSPVMILSVVAVLFVPATSEAFVRTMTCTSAGPTVCKSDQEPIPIRWPGNCATYHIHEDGPADTDRDRSIELIQQGFEVWNAPECSYILFINGGFTDEDRVGYNAFTGQAGNANVIVFRDREWDHAAGIVALTSITYAPSNGDIVDADIEFNGRDYRITTTSDPLRVGIDVGNTIAHEAGHFLGLDHTPVEDATMFATAPTGELDKRSLEGDDVDGVCAVYPSASASEDNSCLGAAPGFFTRPDLGPEDGAPPPEAVGACACSTPAGPTRSGISWALACLGITAVLCRGVGR